MSSPIRTMPPSCGTALRFVTVLLLATFVAGCTPEKARALRTAALGFKVEAVAAIDGIDAMQQAEIAPAPRSSTEATEEFVKHLLALDLARNPLTDDVVDLAADPYRVRSDAQAQAGWRSFLDNLRQQYGAFAAIFDDAERGSYLAAPSVKQAARHAEALTAQLAHFAATIDRYPPVLLQRRGATKDKIVRTLQDRKLDDADRKRRLAELKEEWISIRAAEAELTRTTVERCLRAATLGRGVRNLIETYDRLSVDDLNTIAGSLLDTAGTFTGADYGTLKAKAASVAGQIKADPNLTSAFTQAEGLVENALKSRR